MLSQPVCFLLSVIATVEAEKRIRWILHRRLKKVCSQLNEFRQFHDFRGGTEITYRVEPPCNTYGKALRVHRMVRRRGFQDVCLDVFVDGADVGYITQILERGNQEIKQFIMDSM